MRRTLAITLGAIALIAFLFVGCGSDDSTVSAGGAGATGATGKDAAEATESESTSADSTEPASSDKARFIEEADAICEEADKRQLAAFQQGVKELKKERSQAEDRELLLAAALPPIRQQVEELAALDPPSEEAEEAEAIIAAMEELVSQLEENPSLVSRTEASPAAAVDKRAAEYGFKACADVL